MLKILRIQIWFLKTLIDITKTHTFTASSKSKEKVWGPKQIIQVKIYKMVVCSKDTSLLLEKNCHSEPVLTNYTHIETVKKSSYIRIKKTFVRTPMIYCASLENENSLLLDLF